MILDEGAVFFLLSGYPFRTVPRKEGPPWTWPAPWRSRSSFSFPLSLSSCLLPRLPPFFLSLSVLSHRLVLLFLVFMRQSQDPAEGSARETERGSKIERRCGTSREESRRERRSRGSGEDKVPFYSPPGTRSVPFHGVVRRVAFISLLPSCSLSSTPTLHSRINVFTYTFTYA